MDCHKTCIVQKCMSCSRRFKDLYEAESDDFDIKKTVLWQHIKAAEDFMDKSGIRRFCSDVCKGSCCSGCSRPEESRCHNGGPRNFSCSSFICDDLSFITGLAPYRDSDIPFYEIHSQRRYNQKPRPMNYKNPEKIKIIMDLAIKHIKSNMDMKEFVNIKKRLIKNLNDIDGWRRMIEEHSVRAEKDKEQLKKYGALA